ncbi:MAG: hypothetical protein QM778_18610 [Myxococcales bacterium]
MAEPPGYGVIASELLSLDRVEAALPELAAQQLSVSLEWPTDDLDNPQRWALVRHAEQLGITIIPWLLLPEDQGYWPCSSNADLFVASAQRLMQRWAEEGLSPTALLVDMEMHIDRERDFSALVHALDNSGVIEFLRAGIDREQFRDATEQYRELAIKAHTLGWKVHLTTWSQVLEDYGDGDDDLRQAFGIPVDHIPWDGVFIQAFRTATNPQASSFYVYDYALRARSIFGRRAGIVLGVTQPGMISRTGYASPADLRADVDAAYAAGLRREQIGLISLRGILNRPPTAAWFVRPHIFLVPPLPDAATAFIHTVAGFWDLLL